MATLERCPQNLAFGLTAIIGASYFSVLALSPIRVNMTDSLPRGIWTETTEYTGTVAACLDGSMAELALERRYLTPGTRCKAGVLPMLKHVAAHAGDTVQLDAAGIHVNGLLLPNTAVQTHDSGGRLMPAYASGEYHVAPGELWLYSNRVPNSFDSRYFGPVPQRNIIANLKPILTE